MFDGDGAETIELQAYKIQQNANLGYRNMMCEGCNIVMNPVEFMYSKGLCPPCYEDKMTRRVKGKLA
jgi:hypothetical protein